MNNSDVLFNIAVESLPKPLASAMATNGLVSPALLAYYPRKTAEELGLTVTQEAKHRKVTEGMFSITAGGIAIGYDGSIGSGGTTVIGSIVADAGASTGVGVSGTASLEEVQNSETGSLAGVPNRKMDPSAHFHDPVTHPSLPPSASSSSLQLHPSTHTTPPATALPPISTEAAQLPVSTDFAFFPVSGCSSEQICGFSANVEKQGDVSMILDFSKSAEVARQVGSARVHAHFNPSELFLMTQSSNRLRNLTELPDGIFIVA